MNADRGVAPRSDVKNSVKIQRMNLEKLEREGHLLLKSERDIWNTGATKWEMDLENLTIIRYVRGRRDRITL